MVGVPFPNLHRRLNDKVWADARELRGATEVCRRLHSVIYLYTLEVNEWWDFPGLNAWCRDRTRCLGGWNVHCRFAVSLGAVCYEMAPVDRGHEECGVELRLTGCGVVAS